MGRELSRKSQSVSAAAAAAEESTVVETLCGAERIGFPETSAKASGHATRFHHIRR